MKFKVGDKIEYKGVKSYYWITGIEDIGYRLNTRGYIPFEEEDEYELIQTVPPSVDSLDRSDLEAELEELQTIAFENHEYPDPWLGFDADMACY